MSERVSAFDRDISNLSGVRRPKDGTLATFSNVLSRDPCSYCGDPVDDLACQVDHIQPRASGGPDNWTNYTAACGWCNLLKINTPLLPFLLQREHIERAAFARVNRG